MFSGQRSPCLAAVQAVVVRQREQVEPAALQRLAGFRRGSEPAQITAPGRWILRGKRRFQVGKDQVSTSLYCGRIAAKALSQPLQPTPGQPPARA